MLSADSRNPAAPLVSNFKFQQRVRRQFWLARNNTWRESSIRVLSSSETRHLVSRRYPSPWIKHTLAAMSFTSQF